MSKDYYQNLCAQYKGKPVKITTKDQQVHIGIITEVDEEYVYIQPLHGAGANPMRNAPERESFGYGYGRPFWGYGPGYGYGYGGFGPGYGYGPTYGQQTFGYGIALGSILGLALYPLLF